MKRILLISPAYKTEEARKMMENIWNIWDKNILKKKAFITPLHIATIAALTPGDIEVDLWDELMHGWIDEETTFEHSYDLVGISSFSWSLGRAKQISRLFRKRGIPVAVGGPGVSADPHGCRCDFDVLFIGEAELTWPRFIADFQEGNYRSVYKQDTFSDMTRSPAPCWDKLADRMKSYLMGAVRPSRGCHFDCEYCTVPEIFGRKVRQKSIENVLEEIAALERLGIDRILFCSDNFIGDLSYTKQLLQGIIDLNNSFERPLNFHAEVTLGIAHDEEMLSLLADANFGNIMVGLSEESLAGTNVLRNLTGGQLVENCKQLMAFGLPISGIMVLGFDHDTPETFDHHFEFLQEAFIPYPRIHLLKVTRGTRLYNRLLREGRILDIERLFQDQSDYGYLNPRVTANIIPRQMSRGQLFSGYLDLVEKAYDWDNFSVRVKKFVANVRRKPNVSSNTGFSQGPPPGFNDFLLSLDEKARRAIMDLLAYTHQHGRFMMPKVVTLIIRQYTEISDLPAQRETILKQIRFEESQYLQQFVLVPPP